MGKRRYSRKICISSFTSHDWTCLIRSSFCNIRHSIARNWPYFSLTLIISLSLSAADSLCSFRPIWVISRLTQKTSFHLKNLITLQINKYHSKIFDLWNRFLDILQDRNWTQCCFIRVKDLILLKNSAFSRMQIREAFSRTQGNSKLLFSESANFCDDKYLDKYFYSRLRGAKIMPTIHINSHWVSITYML